MRTSSEQLIPTVLNSVLVVKLLAVLWVYFHGGVTENARAVLDFS